MPDCGHYQALISAKLDGELSPEEEAELQAHLESCPDCRLVYDAFLELSHAVAGLGEEPEPADLTEKIMARVREEAGESAKPAAAQPRRHWRWRSVLPLAACLILLIGIAAFLPKLSAARTADSSAAGAGGEEGLFYACAEDAGEAAAAQEAPSAKEEEGAVPEAAPESAENSTSSLQSVPAEDAEAAADGTAGAVEEPSATDAPQNGLEIVSAEVYLDTEGGGPQYTVTDTAVLSEMAAFLEYTAINAPKVRLAEPAMVIELSMVSGTPDTVECWPWEGQLLCRFASTGAYYAAQGSQEELLTLLTDTSA